MAHQILHMLQITQKTSPQKIAKYIKTMREQKGKEKEALAVINKALGFGHDFVINLFWEEALTYQHVFMADKSDKAALGKMEQTVLTAKFYVEKYKITRWYSRLYRFLGRVSDYKGKFSQSIGFYTKAIKFVNRDPEPFRRLELEAFLYFAFIMSGKTETGYKKSKELFDDFESSKDGTGLKRSDYQTWAIWRSGIAFRTVDAFISKRLTFNKREFTNWLETAEEDLQRGEFSYRKAEFRQISKKLQGN